MIFWYRLYLIEVQKRIRRKTSGRKVSCNKKFPAKFKPRTLQLHGMHRGPQTQQWYPMTDFQYWSESMSQSQKATKQHSTANSATTDSADRAKSLRVTLSLSLWAIYCFMSSHGLTFKWTLSVPGGLVWECKQTSEPMRIWPQQWAGFSKTQEPDHRTMSD